MHSSNVRGNARARSELESCACPCWIFDDAACDARDCAARASTKLGERGGDRLGEFEFSDDVGDAEEAGDGMCAGGVGFDVGVGCVCVDVGVGAALGGD